MKQLPVIQEQINIAVIANDIKYIKDDLNTMKRDLTGKFITQDQFDPIKKNVEKLLGSLSKIIMAVLIIIISAVMALILKH